MSEEFNNISLTLGDDEKFSLICGILAGLRLGNKYSASKVIVTLKPIGVGGYGTIGLSAYDHTWDSNTLRIPVSTHDVDIEYSGFALHLKYDPDRISITSIEDGDFGTLSHTVIGNGEAYTRCMLPSGTLINEPCIVCWLNIRVLRGPTKTDPIEVEFINSTGSNPNDCCLLKWVKMEDNNWYSFFITPTINNGFKITNDDEEEKEEAEEVVEETDVAAKASPSMIALGTTLIQPGQYGCVPLYTNSNLEDEFPYNKFKATLKYPLAVTDRLFFQRVLTYGEWQLNYSVSSDEEWKIINIEGVRAEAKEGASTAAALMFMLDDQDIAISATIRVEDAELYNDNVALGVAGFPGYIYYSKAEDPVPGPDYPPYPDNRGGGGGGGLKGGGSIWSSTAQTIWVRVGNIAYPVYLKAGWNNVKLYLPFIYPEDIFEEIEIIIETESGYILIPGGFEWDIDIKEDAPKWLSSPRIVDRFEIKDVYELELNHLEPPPDLDNLIEELGIADFEGLTKTELTIKVTEWLDNLGINDITDLELIKPIIPVDVDAILDEIEAKDFNEHTLTNIDIIGKENTETMEIEDINDNEVNRLTITEKQNMENIAMTDEIDIELN